MTNFSDENIDSDVEAELYQNVHFASSLVEKNNDEDIKGSFFYWISMYLRDLNYYKKIYYCCKKYPILACNDVLKNPGH